jgi:ABC-type cobalamin transport system ATPase subunit
MLQKNNVMLLDEPTNHLDVESIDALLEALVAYPGTVIVTSHDRHFVSARHAGAGSLLAARSSSTRRRARSLFNGTYEEHRFLAVLRAGHRVPANSAVGGAVTS